MFIAADTVALSRFQPAQQKGRSYEKDPEFMLDDNGVVESGRLIYNAETDDWKAVFDK